MSVAYFSIFHGIVEMEILLLATIQMSSFSVCTVCDFYVCLCGENKMVPYTLLWFVMKCKTNYRASPVPQIDFNLIRFLKMFIIQLV